MSKQSKRWYSVICSRLREKGRRSSRKSKTKGREIPIKEEIRVMSDFSEITFHKRGGIQYKMYNQQCIQTNIQDFVKEHPTLHKDRLFSKILAQMMIHCKERITPEQNVTLQTYKDRSAEFDSTQPAYSALLNFDLGKYAVDQSLPKEKQEGPVDMSQQEGMMQTIVEDLSEEMKREREEEMRNTRGAPSIFFLELSNMSTSIGLLYMLAIIGFFGLIFYVLINQILNKPVDFTSQKKQERQHKKRSTGKKEE
ncbi:UNKNOWN [Stylonychia lemnae]|uniref:Uncharacterized protein n=1 Tax=Stylonychia lemnae TaxID=5949 RepID=A0A078AYZ0_STYLE|nr:UNKNOWN [Stylonychia lemnae]|eukprot:CDW86402.1 UNKNOWN [Stylonychia lemnae]